MHYELRRSKRRKTLLLRIEQDTLVVLAPHSSKPATINAFVLKHTDWINQQLARNQQKAAAIAHKSFTQGGQLLYLGKTYILQLAQAATLTQSVELQENSLHVKTRNDEASAVQQIVFQWYQQEAKALFFTKTQTAAAKIGKAFRSIHIGHYKSKWGSCNSRGDIRYHWQLVQAPEAVIDYVVAHEVCHLLHMNHSSAFWNAVATLCPDYHQQRTWLNKQGHSLKFHAAL